jgi:hypothetical protein
VNTIVINSLGELLDRTTPDAPDPASGRLRENSVFRGVATDDSRLLTSLDRLGGENPPHSKTHLEEHLLRNFLRFAKPFLPDHHVSLWELMVTAEHHGLPTRLLDWTHSPLVAAHFATLAPGGNTDRVVWKLNWRQVHDKFRLSELAFLVEDLDALLKERGIPSSWQFLDQQTSPEKTFVCLLEPPSITQRLATQSGAFTLASVKNKALDEILVQSGLEDALTRYVIPGKRVGFIRDQLDICTIDERRLFPGLDGIAAQLKRYYAADPKL